MRAGDAFATSFANACDSDGRTARLRESFAYREPSFCWPNCVAVSLEGSAPKVWNRFLKSDYHCGSVQVFRPFGHHVAFVFFLVYFIDEQQTLATSHRGRERDQPTARVYSQRFSTFVERFAFDCTSVNQYRKINPEAAASATFWNLTVTFVRRFAVGASQRLSVRFLQEVADHVHALPRS